MNMKTPSFWYQPTTKIAKILSPLGSFYGAIAAYIQRKSQPIKLPIPVVCVGNLVMGGAGKTPVALALAQVLKQQGKKVHFLTRGYGGILKGPVQVTDRHTAQEVGDEPLILAKTAPTWVARQRDLGGLKACDAGAEILIMDDGYQNHSLVKDCSLLVIDTKDGFGNGHIFPAGPLREFVCQGFERANGVILIGDHAFDIPKSLPFIRLKFHPDQKDMEALRHKKVILFAGLARPHKFFTMMEAYQTQYQFEMIDRIDYEDHHVYTSKELSSLQRKAQENHAVLVTTEKDYMRCRGLENVCIVRLHPHLIEGSWENFWQNSSIQQELNHA